MSGISQLLIAKRDMVGTFAEQGKDLSTLICSLRKLRYTRAPVGFKSTADRLSQRSNNALKGLNGISNIVYDLLIAPET